MPAFAPLVLVDASVSPNVNKTYSPTSNGKQALFTDRSPSQVLGWPKLSASVTTATAVNGKSDVTSTMSFPVVPPQVDGCCVPADITYITYEVRAKVSSTSTAEQRASALSLFRAWVASPAFAAVVGGESFY